MMQQIENPLSLIENIDVKTVSDTLQKVKTLQATLKNILVENHDYGKIQGCGEKPTLLKAGAEKILMALGVTSTYEMLEHTEDFNDKGFFAYTVKCILHKNGAKITEGLGHANSKEKKWALEFVSEKELPAGTDKTLLPKKEFSGPFGKYYKYQVTADANSKANTILKMAKKRAQIDAVLTVASLSEVFTQDFDELPQETEPVTKETVNKVKEDIKAQPEDFICSKCGAHISKKIADYSAEKYGKILCYKCQKTNDTESEE